MLKTTQSVRPLKINTETLLLKNKKLKLFLKISLASPFNKHYSVFMTS